MSQDGDISSGNERRRRNPVAGEQPADVPNLQLQALVGEMTRLLRGEMEAVHVRLDRIDADQPRADRTETQPQTGEWPRDDPVRQRRARPVENRPRRNRSVVDQPVEDNYYHRAEPARRGRGRGRPRPVRQEEEDSSSLEELSSVGSLRRHHRARNPRDRTDDNLSGLRLKIPPFHGKNEPDVYLDWEKKIELVFACQDYPEHKKVQVAATEFYDYALTWWDQLVTNRRRSRDRPVETWAELKEIMRRRFVPSHYHRELHQKLRRLSQGSRPVEDYFQEMESLMIKADVDEDPEATMARFLSGMSREIQDRLEMQTYRNIEEMLHKAILVEQQIKRKGGIRPNFTRPTYPRAESSKPRAEVKPDVKADLKGKAEVTNPRNRDIQCYRCQGRGHYANKCPNQRAMILRENGELETEEELESDPSTDLDECEEYAPGGDLLVARRALMVQEKDAKNEQRENLFHTRCVVKDKICSLIVDGGSCTNVASTTMVEKLHLEARKHPRPYQLQWLSNQRNMKVTKQVLVPLSIGKYVDEVLCDVLPMEAGHILLGRPWQFDRRVIHDGFSNKHSFEFKGRKITLNPMSPNDVYKDQLALEHGKESVQSEPPNTNHLNT